MSSGELCRLSRSPVLEQSRERREGSFQIGDELESNRLLLLTDRATALFFIARGFERIARARKALPHIDVAEGAALERPSRRPDLERRASNARERILEQRHQLRRPEVGLDRAKHDLEESARNRTRHGYARRVVDGEVVAFEPCSDTPRQHTVGRDQSRGFSWRLDHRLENQRDSLSLVMRGRRDDEANSGKRIGEARPDLRREPISTEETLPMLSALGRP